MCRNIKPLFNFDPPVTDVEIVDAARQFVRKISGFTSPSKANEAAFEQAVHEVSLSVETLMSSLSTKAVPKNREEEQLKAQKRTQKRFGT